MLKIKTIAMIATASALLAGCATTTEYEPNTKVSKLANPASLYCEKIGGEALIKKEIKGTIIVKDAKRDTGYCRLSDGKIVEEWELFYARNKK